MFTFLNMAKILSWIAMVYMIVTTSDYFMGAIIFYYIVLAVLITMGFFLVCGATAALKSERAPLKAKLDAVVLLHKLTQETYASAIAPAIVSTILLWTVGLPLLAYSQVGVAFISMWCKHLALKSGA